MSRTYLCLGVSVHDSWRAVVGAAAKKVTPRARRDPAQRAARRCFYLQMLEHPRRTRELIWIWRR
jgi:hypothetical protein